MKKIPYHTIPYVSLSARNQRIITWETPQSNGTEYELKVQTYKIDFTAENSVALLMGTEFN